MFAKPKVLILVTLGLVSVACSSSTSTVSAATVSGVCGKMAELSCAKENCTQVLELAQKRCPAKTFQSFLDCASITKMHCEARNGIDVAILESCDADLARVNSCAEDSPASSTAPPAAPSSSGTAVGAACTDGNTCPSWSCSCADGTIVKVLSCVDKKCADPVTACGTDNAEHVNACEGHGGT
jgi:hypothetical protein